MSVPRQIKRRFLYFPSRDFKGVQQYLNQLSEQGWELTSTDHFLTAEFVPTSRKDLTYYVELMDSPMEASRLRQYRDAGWELAGSFNGMRIFKSLPCRSPAPMESERSLASGQLFPHCVRRSVLLLLLLLVPMLVLLSRFSALNSGIRSLWEGLRHSWYLGWLSCLLPVIALLLAVLLVCGLADTVLSALWSRLALQRTGRLPAAPRWLMGVRSGANLAALGCIPLLLLAGGLDFLSLPDDFLPFLLFLLLLGAALLLTALFSRQERPRWQRRAGIGWGAALLLFCAVLLLLSQTGFWGTLPRQGGPFPSSSGWLSSVADRPVVLAKDLALEEQDPASLTYRHGFSPLVSYWTLQDGASSTEAYVSSRFYRCLTAGVARTVYSDLLEDLRAEAAWSQSFWGLAPLELEQRHLDGLDGCWYGVRRDEAGAVTSSALVLLQGRTAAAVQAPGDLMSQLDTVLERLGIRRDPT